jgi:hypothetical protein
MPDGRSPPTGPLQVPDTPGRSSILGSCLATAIRRRSKKLVDGTNAPQMRATSAPSSRSARCSRWSLSLVTQEKDDDDPAYLTKRRNLRKNRRQTGGGESSEKSKWPELAAASPQDLGKNGAVRM